MDEIGRRGLMLVLSSPSGAGKTTIARRVLDEDTGIAPSISHTTREKRRGEVDGKDYYFVDKQTFSRMREQGAFLEWAVVFDNYYGTTRGPVEQALGEGRDVLFDVDWQGATALRDSTSANHELVLECEMGKLSSKAGRGKGRALLDGKVATECDLMFVVVAT